MIQPRIVAISQHRRSHLTRRPTRTPTRMATRAERGVACCRKQLGFGFGSMAMLISGGFLDFKDRRLYLYVCVCVCILYFGGCTWLSPWRKHEMCETVLGKLLLLLPKIFWICKQYHVSDLGTVFKYLNMAATLLQDEINVEERSMCFIEVTRSSKTTPQPRGVQI